ncbi:hypothetical protein A6C57_27995 (plasmid) [Fibrella sp. ES10-3-2-2]
MLIDKYLPAYDFNELHSITVKATATGIYDKMLGCNVSRSFLIRFLFRVRGMSKPLRAIEQLTSLGFIKLDEQPGKEIVYGMITTSPTFDCCQPNFPPASFNQYTSASIIKAVINFQLQEQNNSTHIISTETRVWCGSSQMRARFRWYWFFVKPFSQLIRRSVLKQMKAQISKAS